MINFPLISEEVWVRGP